jgi:ATP-dependent protease ClpP protease subunit
MKMQSKWYSIHARGPKAAEVFIYGDIGDSWYGEGITAKQFVKDLNALDVDSLTVRINSGGGSVPDGLAIFNALRRHKAGVITTIDGMAASIASLIAMAGDTVQIADNAMVMLHAPWSGVSGNSKEMRDRADMLDKWAESMATSYVRDGGLDFDAALALLTDGVDHWYSADEALALGLVTEVVDAIPLAASLNISRFTPPAAAAAFPQEIDMIKKRQKLQAAASEDIAAAAAAAAVPTPAIARLEALREEEVRAAALTEEHARRAEIRAVCQPFLAHGGVE